MGTTDYGNAFEEHERVLKAVCHNGAEVAAGIANLQSAWENKWFVLGFGISELAWIDGLTDWFVAPLEDEIV